MAPYSDTQVREVFHYLFLEQLLKISDPKLYILKGGVNLRFFFKSPRYSEDMDLDVTAGNVATLKKNGYKILESDAFRRSLQTYGIADLEINDPVKAKQTQTTQRFRVRLVNEAGEAFPTKVEFSRRSENKRPSLNELIDPQIAKSCQRLSFHCQHYSGTSAAIQKVEALAGREVTQARDVFDLNILYAGGHVKSEDITKSLPKELLKKAQDNLESIDHRNFKGQVVEFLETTVRKDYEKKETWETLKETVKGLLR